MATEETRLLTPQVDEGAVEVDPNAIYSRFSPWRKRVIITIASWMGFLPLFVSGSFTPTIPQMAEDLKSDGATISLAISLSILTVAFAGMFWASYSGYYGRRPTYLTSLPFLFVGSFGVAQSTSIPFLMFWRVFQSFGASSGASVGAAVIGDIYKLEERGTAMGVFLAACLLGPSVAPLAGGISASYASWRVLQYGISVAGFLSFFLVLWLFPETCHPNTRGMDKCHTGRRLVLLNPFKSLRLMRSPNLLAVTGVATAALIGIFGLTMPLAFTIGVRYDIKDEAVISIFFSAVGTGNILGATIAGRISDHVIVKWKKRRQGKWVPEDRLRGALFAAALVVPVPILSSGIITHYGLSATGIAINLVCLFFTGVGVDMVLTPIISYNVDVMHTQSAEVMSAHTAVRCLVLALFSMAIIPLINLIGVMAANTIFAVICWIGFALLWYTIRNGDRMRAWVDVGYTTAKDI